MMRNLVEITFNIPRELRGNENKLRNYLETKEKDIARKTNCFGASFKGVIVLSFNRCCATYRLIHTEDWSRQNLWK